MALQFNQVKQTLHDQRVQFNRFLWQQNTSLLPLPQRLLIRTIQIFIAVMRDLLQGQLSLRAMSLVFTTLIGFFPLLALTFAVLKGLGVHNALEPTLLTLLEPLGDRANELTTNILNYVDNIQVQLIGITSVGLLIYIVLGMMRKIESSFNYIWSVKQGRSWSSRISEYLFAVIVSPLLLFLSISLTSWVNTNFFEAFLEKLLYGSFVIEFTAFITSILLMSLAFAFAYVFLPNTRVRFSSAFIGGLVTTIIWKLMGSVFQGFFVSTARESIYLAFATAIAVMFFAYIGWLVALVGSSIAYYHQNPGKARSGRERAHYSIAQQEELSLTLAAIIIRRFQRGLPPLTEAELANALSGNPIVIEGPLESLKRIGLITSTADEPPRFLPLKSVTDCSILEVLSALRRLEADPHKGDIQSADLRVVREFQEAAETLLQRELGDKKFIDAP
jgi:membrane protein